MFSFALGAFWQSWRASSSEVAAQINDLLKDVKELETLATEYWSVDASEPTSKLLEVKIRGMTFVIAEFEAQADILFRKHKSAYQKKIDALFIAATGGAFETSERTADFARAITVKECSAAVTALSRRARQDSAGMIAVYWLVRRFGTGLYRQGDRALDKVTTSILSFLKRFTLVVIILAVPLWMPGDTASANASSAAHPMGALAD